MQTNEFRERLEQLSREELLEIVGEQDAELLKQVTRIEWVFSHKMSHLTWEDGRPITERPLTNRELAMLIDEPFTINPDLTKMGVTRDQQRELHIAKDPVLWAKKFLGAEPRVYQILILREPNNRRVLRAGRRLGKTYTMSILLMHYSYTHNDGRCIVVAPMKSHVELIYQEILRLASKSNIVISSMVRKVTSPQFMIGWSNGSTIRFFTSGIRSGGKADVVRGQEAHVIVLDELDYMHADDLESLYAMLQKTAEDQDEKILVGASTPTGRREQFWQWCRSPRFTEFWFPSYCNPFFEKATENEFREQYTEMGYRHEVEADWGEDTEGVYPRRFVDVAFGAGADQLTVKEKERNDTDIIRKKSDWEYIRGVTAVNSFFVIGVDWDKYGAGSNIVVLEVCDDNYSDERARGRIRLAYREEVKRDEYTLTKAVQRVITLNEVFNPRHIYVDRGYGEVQVELLHQYGVNHPQSNLKTRVHGVQFSESIEVKDPFTKQPVKKEIKPFMVDNFRQMLEKERIIFPSHDDELYMQLISYVVIRTTQLGRPVFEATGISGDHVHDALILACLAITQNYGELLALKYARQAVSISNAAFLPLLDIDDERGRRGESDVPQPILQRRAFTVNMGRNSSRPYKRKQF